MHPRCQLNFVWGERLAQDLAKLAPETRDKNLGLCLAAGWNAGRSFKKTTAAPAAPARQVLPRDARS